MSTPGTESGMIDIGNARIYYETAGQGMPLVMMHAGVADSRQWDNEFAAFARDYRVLRYDMRGYGKSEPVEGKFSHLSDLLSILNSMKLREPVVLMGCSMGGGLALDLALAQPSRVKAIILVGAGPSGLELDVPAPTKYDELQKAYDSGNLDLAAELETQIWFDGAGRTKQQVDPAMRSLVYEMDRKALAYEAKQLGQRLPNTELPAFDRLAELHVPVLIIVGAHDTPYILAASDYMMERIAGAQKAVIQDAAHLPNMDQPRQFQGIVQAFLGSLSS